MPTASTGDFDPVVVYLALGREGYRLLTNSLLTMREAGVTSNVVIYGAADELEDFQPPIDNCQLVNIVAGADHFFDWGTAGFSSIMELKLKIISGLLRDFKDILYVDIDVAWIQNPLDHLRQTMTVYDIVFQREPKSVFPSEPCFGFFAARSSPLAISFFQKQYDLFVERRKLNEAIPVQATCREFFQLHPSFLKEIHFLSDYLFPTGPLRPLLLNSAPFPGLIDAGRPYIFHANWIVGGKEKESLLRHLDLWHL
ncbi:MAG: putative nucleotide-diphospho-sugar transferase [Methylocystis sp.]